MGLVSRRGEVSSRAGGGVFDLQQRGHVRLVGKMGGGGRRGELRCAGGCGGLIWAPEALAPAPLVQAATPKSAHTNGLHACGRGALQIHARAGAVAGGAFCMAEHCFVCATMMLVC